jgi:hypothetical protein
LRNKDVKIALIKTLSKRKCWSEWVSFLM